MVTKVQNPDEYDQPCASEEAIYQQIIDDLSYAAMNLPTRDEWGIAERGRVTKGTAEGLLAKVYLFRQDYASVKQYAGQVISRENITCITITVICLARILIILMK